MIQDIGQRQFHNEYEPVPASDGDTVFCFRNRELLYREEEGKVVFPTVREFSEAQRDFSGTLQYLFRIDDERFYLPLPESVSGSGAGADAGINGFSYGNINAFRAAGTPEQKLAAVTAWHLYAWYRDTRHCGRCGAHMQVDGKERAMRCPECGMIVYPRIFPAVIVGVTDGSRILLSRYEGREYKGYSLIAGFCEIGEAAEETVRREVMEETGLKVKNIRYFSSQPWGFESDLLLGFYCDVDGDTTIHRDASELSMAEWVERSEMEPVTELISLTATMMEHFRTEG